MTQGVAMDGRRLLCRLSVDLVRRTGEYRVTYSHRRTGQRAADRMNSNNSNKGQQQQAAAEGEERERAGEGVAANKSAVQPSRPNGRQSA